MLGSQNGPVSTIFLEFLGRGVWQDWIYEVELTSADSPPIPKDGGSTGKVRVLDLDPSTMYSIRVRAASVGGNGPWSEVFNGTTLKTGRTCMKIFKNFYAT